MMPLQGEEIVSRNPDGAQDGLRILGVRFDRLSRAEALRTMSTSFSTTEAECSSPAVWREGRFTTIW